MYISQYYREDDINKIKAFVHQYNFATLVLSQENIPVASHLPVDFEEDYDDTWLINGHMARANKLWEAFNSIKEVLLIFSGPSVYISPTWYDHLNVPTWNYIAVHLYGIPRVINDGWELQAILARLIKRYETKTKYQMETLPPNFVKEKMRDTVGFQVKVTRVEANFKLSQNRNAEDYANIVRQLEAQGNEQSNAIANEMKKIGRI